MSYLGLDVGTSGCKAVVFDDDGKQLSSAHREYSIVSKEEGWAELDSRLVMESCMEVIREAAASCTSDPVRGIGISSQGEAFTAIGPGGEVLADAMVSSDARAASIADSWSRQFGKQRLYEITGHTAAPIFSLFKLLWLRAHLPEVWGNAKAFYCFEDLIQWRLGLDPAISWCLAGRTVMFNVRTHQWDKELLEAVGLSPSKLARPVPSGAIAGTIPKSVADELGLTESVIVVAGGHDQCCGALGAGVASPGRAVYGTGTVDCITPAFPEPIFSDDLFANSLATYDYTVSGMYTTVAYSITGGNILTWFRDEWAAHEVQDATLLGISPYELLLKQVGTRPSGLLVLPYWTPSGTPYFDSEVKGAILGLRMTTTRSDVLRALLEGVAFEMKLNLDILDRSGVRISELVAIGGGAKSRALIQLKADVLNRPIARASVTEAGCMGAAMLAKAADNGTDVKNIAADWVRLTDLLEPDPGNAAFYQEQFGSYLKLYPTLKTLY